MRVAKAFMILLFLIVSFSSSIYAITNADNSNKTSQYLMPATDGSTEEDLTSFVDEAVAYVQEKGQNEAIKVFNNPNGSFIRKDLYIFAYDFNSIELAYPYRHDLVGKNNSNLMDSNGVAVVRNLMIAAKRGNGFSYYVWPNPAHGNEEELKLTYVVKVNDALWLGSGIYLAGPAPYFSPEDRESLTSFVKNARDFALRNGRQKALDAFNNRSGEFVRGDRYIFAYDFNGTTLALPFQPDLIGTNRLDLNDPNGVNIVRDQNALARTGGGLFYLLYPDPAENMTIKLKLNYVMKVDDTWFLGSGIYAK